MSNYICSQYTTILTKGFMHSAGCLRYEYHAVTLYEVGAYFSKGTAGSIAGNKGSVQQYVFRHVRK